MTVSYQIRSLEKLADSALRQGEETESLLLRHPHQSLSRSECIDALKPRTWHRQDIGSAQYSATPIASALVSASSSTAPGDLLLRLLVTPAEISAHHARGRRDCEGERDDQSASAYACANQSLQRSMDVAVRTKSVRCSDSGETRATFRCCARGEERKKSLCLPTPL